MTPVSRIARPGAALLLSFAAALTAPAAIVNRDAPADPNTIRVVTANIRTPNAADGANDWDQGRRVICRDVLLAQKADIICMQEGTDAQLNYLLRTMSGYASYALKVGGQPVRPYNPILYSKERFELLVADGFWLSETPRVPLSISWSSASVRVANWAQLRDRRTGRAFVVWSTHLDNESQLARENQIKVVTGVASLQGAGVPQLLLSDFNAAPSSNVYRSMTGSGWVDTYPEGGGTGGIDPEYTYHNFKGPAQGYGNKIDYIFRRGKFRAIRTEIIKDFVTIDGADRYPSDHYFMSADVTFDVSGGAIPEPETYTPFTYHQFAAPVGISFDPEGSMYVADDELHVVKKVTFSGTGAGSAKVEIFAGISGGAGCVDNAVGARALLNQPRSVALQDGIWYVADSGNNALRIINAATRGVSLYAGDPLGNAAAADGTLETARFRAPAGVVIARDGAIYVADSLGHAIRKIDAAGNVSTLAGALGASGTLDGAAPLARFKEPLAIALDPAEQNLYVADSGNHAIRRISLAANPVRVDTLAGKPGVSGTADGSAANARFNTPGGIAAGGDTVYVADTNNHAIRAINAATGAVSLIAGVPGKETPVGVTAAKDGPGASALFCLPMGVTLDGRGNLYVADTGNGAIRRINLASNAVSTPLNKTTTAVEPEPPVPPAPPASEKKSGGGCTSLWSMLALGLLAVQRYFWSAPAEAAGRRRRSCIRETNTHSKAPPPLSAAAYQRAPLAFGIGTFLVVLSALLLAPAVFAQRTDNRRVIWTGTNGAAWSSSSWATGPAYLGALTTGSAKWTAGTAESSLPFLAGDSVIFDGMADAGPPANRNITIASGGVTVSDMVVSGSRDYTFSGGAITADGGSVAAGSAQLSGSGVAPGGRLIKLGEGTLVLSNTAANVFKGGILLAQGALAIADARALGGNSITVLRASTTGNTAHVLPGAVVDSGNTLLRNATTLLGPVALNVANSAAGLDITGDIYLSNQGLALNIEGDTVISGRVNGSAAWNEVANGGYLVKTGTAMLTLTGGRNWFYGTSIVAAGKLVVTNAGAIGSGNMSVTTGTLVFQGVRGGSFPMSFIGGGRVEVVDSDMTLNWRNSMVSGAPATANNELSQLIVTGSSRFYALASGTLSSVLGGSGVAVSVSDRSTLILGREGLVGGTPGFLPAINYSVVARNLSFDGGGTLILNPNASLAVGGTLALAPGTVITFGGSGVSRLDYTSLAAGGASPDDLTVAPAGSKLITTALTAGGKQRRDYVVVNQGANPMQDIAMTLGAIDTIMTTVSGRLNEDFIMPVTPRMPARGRSWTNSAWARYFTSDLDFDSDTETQPGHSGRLNGLLLGIDGAFRSRVLLGAYAGMAENNLTTSNSTELRAKQHIFGLYVTPRFKRFYLTVDLATGSADSESFRTETAGSTRGEWENKFHGGGAEIGAVFRHSEKTMIRPRVGLRYTRVSISKFDERGASPMLVGDFSDSLAHIFAGVDAARSFKLFNRDAQLGASLGYRHAARSPRSSLDVSFRDAPGVSIPLERGDYYQDSVKFGVSLRAAITRDIQIGLYLEHENGSDYTKNTLGLMVGCFW